ncbi:hypothetical protein MD484_g8363, partial [Candolleomyces efflorescens]
MGCPSLSYVGCRKIKGHGAIASATPFQTSNPSLPSPPLAPAQTFPPTLLS